MKGRTPNKAEKQHMNKVSQLGCVVCRQQGKGIVPCEIHHVEGKTKANAHFKVLPLCFEHHRMGSDKEPISRHPYKARFVASYGTESDLLLIVDKLLELGDFSDIIPY